LKKPKGKKKNNEGSSPIKRGEGEAGSRENAVESSHPTRIEEPKTEGNS